MNKETFLYEIQHTNESYIEFTWYDEENKEPVVCTKETLNSPYEWSRVMVTIPPKELRDIIKQIPIVNMGTRQREILMEEAYVRFPEAE